MRVLILCTGNSCRSQMAKGFVKNWYPQWEAYSAGTFPAANVHPLTIRVMNEIGIDISKNSPKDIDQFLSREFDHVITVCNSAKEKCPVFYGKVKIKTHIGFGDPAESTGNEEEIIANFRRIRDEIKVKPKAFFENI